MISILFSCYFPLYLIKSVSVKTLEFPLEYKSMSVDYISVIIISPKE